MAKSIFETLNPVNVGDHIEKKNGLSYLSWAWAWAELKKHYPDSFYTIYESEKGCFYHTDGKTAWVKTGVTVVSDENRMGIEHIEYLPVMDFKNRSIPVSNITSVDVNKAIQRSLTKAVARHGLGLYIYAGEDLPEEAAKEQKAQKEVDEQARQVAIDTLKKTGSKAQVEYFERQIGTSVDNFTYEQADGAVKRIIAKQKEKEGEK